MEAEHGFPGLPGPEAPVNPESPLAERVASSTRLKLSALPR